jgi:DNA helicase MCM8
VSAVPDFEPLPPSFVRKYIGYARKYCFPKLSSGAKEVLKNFYRGLRKSYHSPDSIPITTRQLESLIRLAQARAKIELREEVTEEDALDVVEIMKESLYDVLTDEYGQLDFRRTTGMSKSKQVNQFIAFLNQESQRQMKATFSHKELIEMARHFRVKGDLDNFIDMLNQNGYLLKKGGNTYKLATSPIEKD